MSDFEKLSMQSPNITTENIKKIGEMFPEVLTEARDEHGGLRKAINFDKLKQILSEDIIEGYESYEFTWVGKNQAKVEVGRPTWKTLRPNKEKSINWSLTENIYIEGDNFEVLKILHESYLGKVKMIYIDPPYNTGRNLIYKNDFKQSISEYEKEMNVHDDENNKLVVIQKNDGRYHSEWCNMMYKRLLLAKNLLKSDGVLVLAIDDNEVHTISLILKEIFSEDIYEHTLVTLVHNPRGVQGKNFSSINEYAIFVYKAGEKIIVDRKIKEDNVDWSQFRNWGGESLRSDAKNCFYPILIKDSKIIGFGDVCEDDFHPKQTEVINGISYVYPIDRNGIERKWRYARQTVESIHSMLRAKKTNTGYEVEIGKTFGLHKTVWNETKYDANEYGTKIINDLVPNNGFTFPKSLWSVYDAIYAGAGQDKNAIIMDFFSGSSTTAHATMLLNAEDDGNRKFIMIQIPEKLDVKSSGYKAGFKTICDIAQKRIEEAGKKIIKDKPYLIGKLDTGFKVFSLDDSNMKSVYYKPSEIGQQNLFATVENIKADRNSEDLLYQVMLSLGMELSLKVKKQNVSGCETFDVDNGSLIACFADSINDEVIRAIASKEPLRVVFKESSFKNSSAKINLKEIFKELSPHTKVKVI